MIARSFAWTLLVLALIAAGRDGLLLLETGQYHATTLASVWSAVDFGALEQTQAWFERQGYLMSWQYLVLSWLLAPAWAVLGGGAFLVALLRRAFGRRRRRWRSGSLG